MTDDTPGSHVRPPDSAPFRPADTAADVAEHLAAAIGTEAWSVAHAGAAALLDPGDGSAVERIRAWAAEAQRRDATGQDEFLLDSVPYVQQELASALAAHPQQDSQARQLTNTVHDLLTTADTTGLTGTADTTGTQSTTGTTGTQSTKGTTGTASAQIATADGHGTVNAVQHGNIYHQVVLGHTERPRRMSRGAAGAVVGVAGAGAAVAGTVAAPHLAGAGDDAAAADLPQGPLADPAAPVTAPGPPPAAPPPPPVPPSVGAGGPVSGGAAVTKTTTVISKAAGAMGAGGAGVGMPAVITMVTVVAVAVTSVTVVVSRTGERASCGSAVDGRSATAALAEAARRTGNTSYRFTVHRGTHRVMGAADPRSRSAWFTQQVGDGPSVAGTIARGKVILPKGTAVPAGADRGLVRSDGAFTDAVDPTAAARLLRSVITAERDGCDFEGTLRPAAPPSAPSASNRGETVADAEPNAWRPQHAPGARSKALRADPATTRNALRAPSWNALRAAPSAPSASPSPSPSLSTRPSRPSRPSGSATAFTARIDKRGRLVRLDVDAVSQPGGAAAVSARYSHFGLAVTPSVPPTPSAGGGSSAPASDSAVQLDGRWAGNWSVIVVNGTFDASLKEDGGRITGDLTVSGIEGCDLNGALTGTLNGDRITFGSAGGTTAITFSGTVSGDSMKGEFSTACQGGAKGGWAAKRVP
ncbi:hypothetical protein GPA10_12815 [Streptomyces sp. p1417]|uniref:Uncharacterized protein n=1 Tax=Streptomyces typhae TaxID=2681492 RepID=A0A6L6WXB5_9ACTN|nr:hypothetical protein [Streptomyces typhae]MVO85611.1 hypothetical protein [Streptomyces typhae]